MKIDKEFLIEYLLNSKQKSYILELYKIYDLSCKVTKNNIFKNKRILDELEDRIYTVDGKVLSQKERIIHDLTILLNTIDKASTEKEKGDLLEKIEDVIDTVRKSKVSNIKIYDVVKQNIVILQAQLKLPINFFFSASVAFLDAYESAYINKKILDENKYSDKFDNDIKEYINEYNDYFNDISDIFGNKKILNKEDK